MAKQHMAVDQYGQTFHALGEHPRKALIEKIGVQHCSKMYCDKKDGRTVQTGWVIGGHWLTVFEVQPMERPA